jgi:hypothetical protein
MSNATPIQHVTGNLARGVAPGLSPITQPICGDNLEERKVIKLLEASRRFCKVDFRLTTTRAQLTIIRSLIIDMKKDLWIHGCFSKPKGLQEQNILGNTSLIVR